MQMGKSTKIIAVIFLMKYLQGHKRQYACLMHTWTIPICLNQVLSPAKWLLKVIVAISFDLPWPASFVPSCRHPSFHLSSDIRQTHYPRPFLCIISQNTVSMTKQTYTVTRGENGWRSLLPLRSKWVILIQLRRTYHLMFDFILKIIKAKYMV